MKIVFTGGGTGGHFYPIIAVAQKVNKIIDEDNIIGAKLYYMSDTPYDKEAVFENGLIYEQVSAGKIRTYFSFKNFSDIIKMAFGVMKATYKMFTIYPDVVFGKGGYASFPVVLAARILRIPVVIHESDSAPGRVNLWAGKFAKKVAVSFESAGHFFPKDRTAWTGQPIRNEIESKGEKDKALEYLKLESKIPVILILGGSQGAALINDTILDALPLLVEKYQVIHQTGVNNFQLINTQAQVNLEGNVNQSRYTPIAFLNPFQMKMASGAADLIISRAGSFLFEIASWGTPAILVPITKTNMDHQRKNAFAYARSGACSVVEEANMTANILFAEIERIMSDQELWEDMAHHAKAFHKEDAADKIAREIINIALKHEK